MRLVVFLGLLGFLGLFILFVFLAVAIIIIDIAIVDYDPARGKRLLGDWAGSHIDITTGSFTRLPRGSSR